MSGKCHLALAWPVNNMIYMNISLTPFAPSRTLMQDIQVDMSWRGKDHNTACLCPVSNVQCSTNYSSHMCLHGGSAAENRKVSKWQLHNKIIFGEKSHLVPTCVWLPCRKIPRQQMVFKRHVIQGVPRGDVTMNLMHQICITIPSGKTAAPPSIYSPSSTSMRLSKAQLLDVSSGFKILRLTAPLLLQMRCTVFQVLTHMIARRYSCL